MKLNVSARLPAGLSFEVADLLLLQAWADFHDLRLGIDLDIRARGKEYEEVLSLHERATPRRLWTLWRSDHGIIVQPAIGRARVFRFMADAIDSLIAAPDAAQPD